MEVSLFLYKKDGLKKQIKLPSSVTIVGRRRDCDLCIPLMMISRKHCEINTDQNKLHVRDLNSRNGTYVNGNMVEESMLKPGDILRIASLEFGVQINGIPENMETVRPARLFEEEVKPEIPEQQEPRTVQEDAFDDMIHNLDDFDMHQTVNTEQKVDMNLQ